MDTASILSDLAAEHSALDAVLTDLSPHDWVRPTPSAGWSVADQISHLQFFDERAVMALVDPEGFVADRDALIAAAPHDGSVDLGRRVDHRELLDRWRRSSAALRAVTIDDAVRVQWYGPAMSVASFVTARLMECWTHGHDVCTAVGHDPIVTARLRHVAHIGVTARPFSLAINGLAPDTTPIRVDLVAPDGSRWSWGPADATDLVSGDALDFCLVVTQRRRPEESGLGVVGDSARTWIDVAQAFAGPPRRRP